MKYIFTLFVTGCLATAFSQTPFQGKVVYNLHTPQEKTDALLTAYFGNGRIRLEFAEKGKTPDNDIIVVTLDSGQVIHLRLGAQTFTTKKLVARDLTNYKDKTILGYSTSPKANPTSFGDGMTELFNQSVFYVANDLFFPVPEKYRGNTELIMVHENRLVLGAEIVFGPNRYKRELSASDSAELERNRLSAEAIDVKPFHPEDSLFTVPVNFTPEATYDAYNDTTMTYTEPSDSVAAPQSQPLKKKKSSPADKKTATQKPPAHRRKNG